MIKIVVDGFGGDLSPFVNVEGAIMALNEIDDLYMRLKRERDMDEDEEGNRGFVQICDELISLTDLDFWPVFAFSALMPKFI